MKYVGSYHSCPKCLRPIYSKSKRSAFPGHAFFSQVQDYPGRSYYCPKCNVHLRTGCLPFQTHCDSCGCNLATHDLVVIYPVACQCGWKGIFEEMEFCENMPAIWERLGRDFMPNKYKTSSINEEVKLGMFKKGVPDFVARELPKYRQIYCPLCSLTRKSSVVLTISGYGRSEHSSSKWSDGGSDAILVRTVEVFDYFFAICNKCRTQYSVEL